MSVRVVGGAFGGRRLDCPEGLSVRPMTARIKNAVFNILYGRVEGARVLDLYAGSGGLGVEALSRGAGAAVFVERDPVHAKFLRQNLEKIGIEARVLEVENQAALRTLAPEGMAFDLILADPPFSKDPKVLPPEVFADLEALATSPIWAPGGALVLEHRRGDPPLPQALSPLETDRRDYGDATVRFFTRRLSPSPDPSARPPRSPGA